ncbi:hypothetical protein PH562_30465, partial [Rhizobium sp. CNPSo 4062]|uniref:hypothetical protein n=1 Tax=Rhizobium sp. CNPSo 4062 TaxID=3021410 RepID=UPI00254E0930
YPATAHYKPLSLDKGIESSMFPYVYKYPRTGLIKHSAQISQDTWISGMSRGKSFALRVTGNVE